MRDEDDDSKGDPKGATAEPEGEPKAAEGEPKAAEGEPKAAEGEQIVFKDEERTGADRLMTAPLCSALLRLGTAVNRRWPSLRLRVTEAWDEEGEHGALSFHYEGRAADLTTSDLDRAKLGQLAALAVAAKFAWVFFEDQSHVHVSVQPARGSTRSR